MHTHSDYKSINCLQDLTLPKPGTEFRILDKKVNLQQDFSELAPYGLLAMVPRFRTVYIKYVTLRKFRNP